MVNPLRASSHSKRGLFGGILSIAIIKELIFLQKYIKIFGNQNICGTFAFRKKKKMKIAFLISAFTDAPHLLRFVNSLPSDSDCYIHIDASYDAKPFADLLLSCEGRQGRVVFIEKRVRVMWGSFTQVQFQMELIRAAFGSDTRYDYLFMLSGQDYPVWSNRHIINYLTEHKGRNFLQGICMVGLPEIETYEYTRYRFLNNKPWRYGTLKSKFRVLLRTIAQPFLRKSLVFSADGKEYRLYKGSDYFALTGEFAHYLLDTYDHSPQLRRYFYTGFAPSETFTHTVAFNSRFADTCMLVKDPVHKLEELTPLTYIEYGNKIKELTEDDYEKILASGKMFCRKCVTGVSNRLMDMIDEQRHKE
jgi:hypothetical protein